MDPNKYDWEKKGQIDIYEGKPKDDGAGIVGFIVIVLIVLFALSSCGG